MPHGPWFWAFLDVWLILLNKDGEGREEWLGGTRGLGIAFILCKPDSLEVIDELELCLAPELCWLGEGHLLAGWLSVWLLSVCGGLDTSCSLSSLA